MAVKCTTIAISVLKALASAASDMLKISALNNYNNNNNNNKQTNINDVLALHECNRTNSNKHNNTCHNSSYNTKTNTNSKNKNKGNCNSGSNSINTNNSDCSFIIRISCSNISSSSSNFNISISISSNISSTSSNIKSTPTKETISNTYTLTHSVSHTNNNTINVIKYYINNNNNSNNNRNNCNHLYANNYNSNNNEILNVMSVNIDNNKSTVVILINTMDILTTSDHSSTISPSSFMSYLINSTGTTTTATVNTININKSNYDIQIDIQLLNNDYLDLTTTVITTYNNETTWMHPSETDIILGIFLSVLIFLSIAGNILVCVAIYTERSLRRIGNLFLASLAIADLFVASLVMTFAGINDLLGYWIFGADFCDTWVAFDVMCSTASILNLCAISLDRYIHIKDPLRYGRWVTRRVAIITIATIWLLAAFVSFVPISMGLHRPDQPLIVEDNGKRYPTCALDLTPTYAIVSSSISFYFPCVVMIAIYCRLYCYAQKHVKSIKAVTRPGEIAEKQRYKSIRRSKAQQQLQQQHQQKKFKVRNLHSSPYHVSDHKAAITVGVIMGVFLICWVPFFCVNIVAAFCKTCIGGQTFKILSWLGYSNSAFNPIIYSIFNKEFRDAFKRILTTRIPCYCGQVNVNTHSRNCDRYVTDYTTKQHVVAINSGHSSAEIEQVSAI